MRILSPNIMSCCFSVAAILLATIPCNGQVLVSASAVASSTSAITPTVTTYTSTSRHPRVVRHVDCSRFLTQEHMQLPLDTVVFENSDTSARVYMDSWRHAAVGNMFLVFAPGWANNFFVNVVNLSTQIWDYLPYLWMGYSSSWYSRQPVDKNNVRAWESLTPRRTGDYSTQKKERGFICSEDGYLTYYSLLVRGPRGELFRIWGTSTLRAEF